MLARLAGRADVTAGDPGVAQLAALCGYLPLAIGMASRQLAHHPAWTPADLAADLAAAKDRLELMATEMATNSVQHAQTGFELVVERGQGQIRIEVRDTGPGRPVPRSPTPRERTGRGLRIVEAMSDSWGVDPSSAGKTVWFTIPQRACA